MKLLLLLCLLPSVAIAADPEKWFKCESSDDCILAKGPCGAPTAVNRAFRGPFEKSAKKVACKDSFDFKAERKKKAPACSLENKCVTIERKP